MPRRLAGIFFGLAGVIGFGAAANADSSGTGFAVGDGRSVLTNFHVVNGCKSVRIGNVGTGQVSVVDERNDIAIIEIARPISTALPLRTGGELRPGEEIIVIGYPLRGLLSSAPTVTTGIVSSLAGLRDDRTRFQISAPIQPGNSGGPVLDRGGNVVGVVVSKLNVLRVAPLIGDIPQNVNFAIPASIIMWTLNSNSMPYQVGAFSGEQPVSQVVSTASPAVVAIECAAKGPSGRMVGVPSIPSPKEPMPPHAPGYYGAIAWDPGNGRRGWSWDRQTQSRADEVALSECGATGCKIIMRTGRKECASLATTETGKYVGAASRRDREAARLAALKDCEKGKAGECIVRVTDCNK